MEFIFWTLFGLVFWCFIGYPLGMFVRAWLWPTPLQVGPVRAPLVSVVLAVRNGSDLLRPRVENLLAQEEPPRRLEMLIVCNGCTDESEPLARELARTDTRIRVLVGDPVAGKSGALNLGAQAARGEFLIFADIRQRFAPGAVERLLEPFADPEVGAVGGRLVIGEASPSSVEGVRSYWKLETGLRRAESRTGSVIGVSGAIYALRRELFQPLPERLILDDVLVPMRVALEGKRVVLQESAIAYDTPSANQEVEFRRKVRTLAGNLELLRSFPVLLTPRGNPLFIRFVSHKVLRLLAPLCLLGMLVCAGMLAGVLYRIFFWGGLSLYALGVLGFLIPLPGLSFPAAFVMIHLAVFSAFLRFREDAASLWSAPGAESGRGALPDGSRAVSRR